MPIKTKMTLPTPTNKDGVFYALVGPDLYIAAATNVCETWTRHAGKDAVVAWNLSCGKRYIASIEPVITVADFQAAGGIVGDDNPRPAADPELAAVVDRAAGKVAQVLGLPHTAGITINDTHYSSARVNLPLPEPTMNLKQVAVVADVVYEPEQIPAPAVDHGPPPPILAPPTVTRLGDLPIAQGYIGEEYCTTEDLQVIHRWMALAGKPAFVVTIEDRIYGRRVISIKPWGGAD